MAKYKRKYRWRDSTLLSMLLGFVFLSSEGHDWLTPIKRQLLVLAIAVGYSLINYRFLWQKTQEAGRICNTAYRAIRGHGMKALHVSSATLRANAGPFLVILVSAAIFAGMGAIAARQLSRAGSLVTVQPGGVLEMGIPARSVGYGVAGIVAMSVGVALFWTSIKTYRSTQQASTLPIRIRPHVSGKHISNEGSKDEMYVVRAVVDITNQSQRNVSLEFLGFINLPGEPGVSSGRCEWIPKNALPFETQEIVNIPYETTVSGTLLMRTPAVIWKQFNKGVDFEKDIDMHRDVRIRIEDKVTGKFALSHFDYYPSGVTSLKTERRKAPVDAHGATEVLPKAEPEESESQPDSAKEETDEAR